MSTKTPAKLTATRVRPVAARLPHVLAAGLVFIAAGSVLVLEILSVRLLTPYVGLTLETTTSIIGAVLAGIALGAACGGRIADRMDPLRLVLCLLIGGGLLALLTLPIVRALGPSASGGGNAAAVGVTFAALVPVAAVLSAVSPTVARLQLRDLQASGTVVGQLSAWATAGALVGTFGAGFVLVPLFPVSTSVLGVGFALVIAGLVLAAYTRRLNLGNAVAVLLAALAFGALTAALHSPCDLESLYHCVRVEVDPEEPMGRILILDREYNSYDILNKPTFLGFRYTNWLADAIKTIGKPKEPLTGVFVGGGGFTLPRWLIATRPGSHASVLEVDPKLVEFDRQHLGLRTSSDLRAIIGDARVTMRKEPNASANFVIGDAFSGLTVPWQLMTTEWLKEVKRVLRPGGMYALNMIDLRPLGLLRAEAATLLKEFRNVRMVTTPGSDGRPRGDNEELFASDGPMTPEHGSPPFGAVRYSQSAVEKLVGGVEPLRDDYAPVDQLQTR